METKIATNIEEAVAAMSARLDPDGDDWIVKVSRRPSMAGPQETVAIFEGASMQQLLSPEPWLQKFSGGSQFYSFRVVHAKDRNQDRPTAIYTLPAIPGAPQTPNVKMVSQPGWNGPTTITFPSEETPRNGATKWPGVPDSHTGAPRQPAASADGNAGPSMAAQLQEERLRLAEERHRMEMDAIRRESDADRKRFEQQMRDLMVEIKTRPAEPKADPMETITKIVTVGIGLLTPLLPHLVGLREANAKREEDRLRREREDRQETLKLFQAMNEKAAGASADTMKVITPMVDAVAQMGRTVLQQITMMREITAEPPQDEGLMGVIKAGISAWAEVAARGGMNPMIPNQQIPSQATPPRTMAPQPQPQPAAQPTAETADGQTETREITPAQMLDLLADAIRAHETEEDLASDIVETLKAQDFVEAVIAEGGAIAAIQRRLGAEWGADAANIAYIQKVFSLVGQIANAKGVDVRPLMPPGAQ